MLKKLGEVQLIANDVFNQNTGFGRSWNSLYMQNSRSSVIGRYYGVKFSYNLRRYGRTRKGETIDESGVRRNNGDFRRNGGPGGGPEGYGGGPARMGGATRMGGGGPGRF